MEGRLNRRDEYQSLRISQTNRNPKGGMMDLVWFVVGIVAFVGLVAGLDLLGRGRSRR